MAEEPVEKPKKSKKMIIIIASISILVLAVIISIIIPQFKHQPEEAKGLEYGFEVGGCDPIPTTHCAYKSETNEFDIENVTITFYYGGDFDEDLNSYLKHTNIPEFDAYFELDKSDDKFLVKHKAENFVSEKYRCKLNNSYDNPTFLIFNYSEEITIPKELFTEEQGRIWFCIGGVNVNSKEKKYEIIAGIGIRYQIKDNKVILNP